MMAAARNGRQSSSESSHFCSSGVGHARIFFIDVAQKPIVIHHKIGADNIQNLLHFQIVIVPDAAASARYRIDMAEADNAGIKTGAGMLLGKLSERLLQRVGQIFGAALLFLR